MNIDRSIFTEMTEVFTASVMIFIEQFRARWPWSINCWNPDCRCHLLPKSRRLPFSGFLPLDVSSPAMGDIFRSGHCRCVHCSGSQFSARQRPLLKMSPTGLDETSRGRNPENGRCWDFGRRRRHRQSGFQHIDRPRPSSLELFNKDQYIYCSI